MKLKFTFLCFVLAFSTFAQLPEGFVYVDDVIPDIQIDLRYCSHNNFVGQPIDGYEGDVCILSAQATNALKAVQDELRKDSLSLKIFDAYRPQRAVDHFWKWAKQVNDTIMKQQFYPNVDKRNLFKEEYIATRSRHSSGSTLDLTLVNLKTGVDVDMGTPYDFFGVESWILHEDLTKEQKANRMLLQTIMRKHGFRNYSKEWWHFTLRNEPFKDQYFDFIIE